MPRPDANGADPPRGSLRVLLFSGYCRARTCRFQRTRSFLARQRRSVSILLGVKRVLLTGMSGTGKSRLVRERLARGNKAIDTDDGWSEPLPDGRQQWR